MSHSSSSLTSPLLLILPPLPSPSPIQHPPLVLLASISRLKIRLVGMPHRCRRRMRKTMSRKPSPLQLSLSLSLFQYCKGRLRRHCSTHVCQQPSLYVVSDLCLRRYSYFVGKFFDRIVVFIPDSKVLFRIFDRSVLNSVFMWYLSVLWEDMVWSITKTVIYYNHFFFCFCLFD